MDNTSLCFPIFRRLNTQVARLGQLIDQVLSLADRRNIHLQLEAENLVLSLQQQMQTVQEQMEYLQKRVDWYQNLVHTTGLITSSFDLDQVLEHVIDTAITISGAERAYLVLQEAGDLTIRVARNWDHLSVPEPEVELSRHIVQKVVETGEAILTVDAQADPRLRDMTSVTRYKLRAILCVPLLLRGTPLGALYADSRDDKVPFVPDHEALLTALANQAAIAIENARLFAEIEAKTVALQHSRQQIVITREEERRRLRRDLHDGIGSFLASLTLRLDATRILMNRDTTGADKSLIDLKDDVQTAVVDIRRLVYNLRPPCLDEMGLVQTLQNYAIKCTTSTLQINVESIGLVRAFSAAVEVALYRIATEAMTNVVRHAAAHYCSVRLSVDRMIVLEIQDDGQGIPSSRTAGVGLTSMRERAAELGGEFVIESRPGEGTQITVTLPIEGI